MSATGSASPRWARLLRALAGPGSGLPTECASGPDRSRGRDSGISAFRGARRRSGGDADRGRGSDPNRIEQSLRVRNKNRSDGESGSGTLLVAGLAALALTCALILAASSVVLGERARLDAVAALSALAGADVSATALWEDVGDRPCATAGAVARENGAVMESCEVLGADTRVIVSVRRSVLGFYAPIRARARAGSLTEPAEGSVDPVSGE